MRDIQNDIQKDVELYRETSCLELGSENKDCIINAFKPMKQKKLEKYRFL